MADPRLCSLGELQDQAARSVARWAAMTNPSTTRSSLETDKTYFENIHAEEHEDGCTPDDCLVMAMAARALSALQQAEARVEELQDLVLNMTTPEEQDFIALRSRAETAEAELRWIAEHDLRYTERI